MNDNQPTNPVVERAIDEIELILMDHMNEILARKLTILIIPIVGRLIRDVMNDTAETIMRELNK